MRQMPPATHLLIPLKILSNKKFHTLNLKILSSLKIYKRVSFSNISHSRRSIYFFWISWNTPKLSLCIKFPSLESSHTTSKNKLYKQQKMATAAIERKCKQKASNQLRVSQLMTKISTTESVSSLMTSHVSFLPVPSSWSNSASEN